MTTSATFGYIHQYLRDLFHIEIAVTPEIADSVANGFFFVEKSWHGFCIKVINLSRIFSWKSLDAQHLPIEMSPLRVSKPRFWSVIAQIGEMTS